MAFRIISCWLWVTLMGVLMGVTSVLQATQDGNSRFLESAIHTADWLESVTVMDGNEAYWPMAPDESQETEDSLYSGNPGIILFLAELYRTTGNTKHLELARKGANRLARISRENAIQTEPGLFTGVAGQAWILDQLGQATSNQEYSDASNAMIEHLARRAITSTYRGCKIARWNNETDIISGSAGIGVVLIEAWHRTGREEYFDLAVSTGDGLLSVAVELEVQGQSALKWMMSPDDPREMPNYSHGTAGVCDFLLMLDCECRTNVKVPSVYDGRFRLAVGRGARYLISLSVASPGGFILHHFPGGADLNYLGWCHGPAGSMRLFDRMASVKADVDFSRLGKEFHTILLNQLLQSNLPDRSSGFWNNVGVCCGNGGVIGALLDHAKPGDTVSDLTLKLAEDLLARSTKIELQDGRIGLKWKQAEHRTRPEFEQAQTGLMQGAAGIGLVLIKLHKTSLGLRTESRLPVLPF